MTVELNREEINNALADYLSSRGYQVEQVSFKFNNFGSTKVDGAVLQVTKTKLKGEM